ncbi:4227_t:CDS:1 [Racocetra persica]|uniref:4227_t:CDS:1 n=1 Tax=Racocetra persica TaxID=160502 RepID=A0ACA9NZQ7_9GLOM|nr:4227_t:CDS:1 [Racocetra persica]
MWKDENHETILYYKKLADSKKLDYMKKYPNYVYKLLKKCKKHIKAISKNSLKINAKTPSTLSFTYPKESPDISIINKNNIKPPIPFNELNFDTSKYFDENNINLSIPFNELNFDTSTNFENNINYPIPFNELNFGYFDKNINRSISFNELYSDRAFLNFNNIFMNFYLDNL